jgi:hypothetical protein
LKVGAVVFPFPLNPQSLEGADPGQGVRCRENTPLVYLGVLQLQPLKLAAGQEAEKHAVVYIAPAEV